MRVITTLLWILASLMALGAVLALLPKTQPSITIVHVPPSYARPQGSLKCAVYKKLQGRMKLLAIGMKMKEVVKILGPPSEIRYGGPKGGNEEATHHLIAIYRPQKECSEVGLNVDPNSEGYDSAAVHFFPKTEDVDFWTFGRLRFPNKAVVPK